MFHKWQIQLMLVFLFFQSRAFGLKFSYAATGTSTSSSFIQPIHSTIRTVLSDDRKSTKSLLLYMAISDKKATSASTGKSKIEKMTTATPVKKRKGNSGEANESSTSTVLESKDPINKKKSDKAAPKKSKKDISALEIEIPTTKSNDDESRSKNKEISNNKSILKMSAEDRNLIVSDILSVIMQEVGEGDRRYLDRELDISCDEKGGGGGGGEDSSSTGGDSNNNNKHNKLLNGVVRIYCTHSLPNFGMPWQRQKQEFSTSTGFMIDGRRILTNAHAVEYGSLIQVKKRQSEQKYVASVVAIAHECDLAILSVDDASFWENTESLTFGDIPDLQEDVAVVGFPVGGDSISISSGVVSRIEMQEYAQASAELLAIQIDAAINPGNSGGPVVNNRNEVIGVAFQSISEEDIENIGYVVPVNVINHFLNDVKANGKFSGVSGLGVKLQGMDNQELRRYYNMTSDDTGVLVVATVKLSPASKVLQKGDVILCIDGIRVANDGTIPFREGSFKERVQLSYYFTQRFSSDNVTLDILREGQRMKVRSPLWVPQYLIPRTLLQNNYINTATNAGTGFNGSIVGGVPSYLMIGGLVMVALNREYLNAEYHVDHMHEFERWSEELLTLSMLSSFKDEPDQEVVLLSQVLAHSCNIGYETQRNLILSKCNGIAVRSLKHLKQVIESSDSVNLVFESKSGSVVVLNRLAALAAQDQLCREHFIPSPCSLDLLE